MADEQTVAAPPKRRSILPKLLLLAVAMLVVAALVNLKDLRAIASGDKTFTSVLYGRSIVKPSFAFPEPFGPEDAKVKVSVVCQEGNGCHKPLVALWTAVALAEPERLRVEFGSQRFATKPGGQPTEIGCEAGVAINGDTKFELGKGKDKRVLYLNGPTPMPVPMEGMPQGVKGSGHGGHGWTTEDVATILNQYIQKQYKQKGTLTASAITAAMPEAEKLIPKAKKAEGAGASPPAEH